jgi:hypothetical protein
VSHFATHIGEPSETVSSSRECRIYGVDNPSTQFFLIRERDHHSDSPSFTKCRKSNNSKGIDPGTFVALWLSWVPGLEEEGEMRTVGVSLTVVFAVLVSGGVHGAPALNAIRLFRATPVTESAACGNSWGCSAESDRVVFDEATLLLSCRAHPTAVLSSTPDGSGRLVADNFIEVNGRNVCTGGETGPGGVASCFNWPVIWDIGKRALDAYQPVPPLNVSGDMPRGRGIVTFALVDYSGIYANSDIWLVTDCVAHEKAAICHKPGTPAEKVLTVGVAAISGHLRHGDTTDVSACRR